MIHNDHTTEISNVLIIGCGGAGLRAAIEVKIAGLTVTVLGKRAKTDLPWLSRYLMNKLYGQNVWWKFLLSSTI